MQEEVPELRGSTHICEVVTAGLDGLDKESAGSGVSVHSANEVLHRRLMRKVNQVTHMVDNQPGQMLRVMEVLTLER